MSYRHQRSMPLIRIGDLITIHYYQIEPNFHFQGEIHPFWEMVYVDNGAINARNGDKDLHALVGELLFHAPDTFHYAQGDGVLCGHIFIISFTSRSPAMDVFRDMKITLPQKMRSMISGIMLEANTFYDMEVDGLNPLPNAPRGGDQLIRLYLEQLLIMLYREQTNHTSASQAKDLPGEIILYLNSRIYETLSIPELCSRLHYGKTHLSRLFKEETGVSIMQYYRQLKLNEAKRLLREPERNLAEVAVMLCYDTPQYFSHVFKKSTGISPGKYRSALLP